MNYQELKMLFRRHESTQPKEHLTAYITFSSFGPQARTDYTLRERTYVISSDNKAFQPNKGGYSIFGSCLDGKTDPCLRLEQVMADEHGGKSGWIVEDCCIVGCLLTHVNERDIVQQQIFYSHGEAVDAMLQSLCRWGELDLETIQCTYNQQDGELEAGQYGAVKWSAWLNAGRQGNWDWNIQVVRIHGPLEIVLGDIPDTPK